MCCSRISKILTHRFVQPTQSSVQVLKTLGLKERNNMVFFIGLIIGLFIGVIVGVALMAVLNIGTDDK